MPRRLIIKKYSIPEPFTVYFVDEILIGYNTNDTLDIEIDKWKMILQDSPVSLGMDKYITLHK